MIIFQAHEFSALFLDIDIAIAKRFHATSVNFLIRLPASLAKPIGAG
ncbi:hypothetical protein [Rhizobium sp. 9140]|nr:hypothetical protein [Rhizobium sp. 9140]